MKKIIILLLAVATFSSFTTNPFTVEEENIRLRLENPDLSTVHISVMDSNSTLMYEDKIKQKKYINILFNFDNTYSDTYTIKVVDGDTTYQKLVKI